MRSFGSQSQKFMTTKLTLSVPPKFKRTAEALSRSRKKSISALVVELVEREAAQEKEKMPFQELLGIWADRDITLEKIREKAWRKY